LGLMGAPRGHMGAFMKRRDAVLGHKERALRHEGRAPEREETRSTYVRTAFLSWRGAPMAWDERAPWASGDVEPM
jgi:hypothetical protein